MKLPSGIALFAGLVATAQIEGLTLSTVTVQGECQPSSSDLTSAPSTSTPSSSAQSTTPAWLTSLAPSSTQQPTRASQPVDHLTVSVSNGYGNQLSISLGSNAGGPSPINDPPASLLSHASTTQYLFPTGWAGRINIGPNLNPNGSKIEASFTGPPDIDVSYVDGFSVPITCSVRNETICGCNLDLFRPPNPGCPSQREGPICLNPARESPDGPAAPFFAACAGAAYTYPNDNTANVNDPSYNPVSCCVGVGCPAPARQRLPGFSGGR